VTARLVNLVLKFINFAGNIDPRVVDWINVLNIWTITGCILIGFIQFSIFASIYIEINQAKNIIES
jgi:hypothetical protein